MLFGCLVGEKNLGLWCPLVVTFFCKLHSWYFCSFHDCKTFQGWAGKKAASLRTVYCSGFTNGVIVIKKQKAKTQVKSNKRQKELTSHPNRLRKYHPVNVGVWLEPARACFPVLV